MSDSRIHLLFTNPKNEGILCGIYFPALTLEQSTEEGLLLRPLQPKEFIGLEALVRSLAAKDSLYYYEHSCQECGYSTVEKHKRFTISNLGCPRCHEPMQSMKLDEKGYDSKLKVTFGAGTYIDSCSKAGAECCIHDCDQCDRNGECKDLIEPLQPIEQVCKELGVEIFYV